MNSYREAQRLGQMESTLRQEQEKYQQRRDTGTGNRRNQSQVQYDLMTLDYKSTPGGQALKQQVRGCGEGVPGRPNVARVLWCSSWHLAAVCALLRGEKKGTVPHNRRGLSGRSVSGTQGVDHFSPALR